MTVQAEPCIVAGHVTMQVLTLEDGTTLAVELEEPLAVFAVVVHGPDGVRVASMHRTEAEAAASITPEDEPAKREGGSVMSVGQERVEVSGYLVTKGEAEEVVPCEPMVAHLYQAYRDGKRVVSKLFWSEAEAKAAVREATVTLGRLPGVMTYLGRPPTPHD